MEMGASWVEEVDRRGRVKWCGGKSVQGYCGEGLGLVGGIETLKKRKTNAEWDENEGQE